MSQFAKLIIPLIEPKFKLEDFTDNTGFIDCYTSDPDKPSSDKEFFVVFNDKIRNKHTEDLSIRLSHSFNIKKTYVKMVNNTPYYVYSFYVKPELKKLYNGICCLDSKQKTKIINFWNNTDDIINKLLSNTLLHLTVDNNMPLNDYESNFWHDKGLTIKGDSL